MAPPAVPPPSYVSPQLCTRRSCRNPYSFTIRTFSAAGEYHRALKTKVGLTLRRNVGLIQLLTLKKIGAAGEKSSEVSGKEASWRLYSQHPPRMILSSSTTVSASASELWTSAVPAQNTNNCNNNDNPAQISTCTVPTAVTFGAFLIRPCGFC